MASWIYIENLPHEMSEEGLKLFFSQIGDVQSINLETDGITTRPNGSGFVEMSLDLDAYRAINCLDGAMIKNRKIRMKEVTSPKHTKTINLG